MSRRRPGSTGSGCTPNARFRKGCYQHTHRCPSEIDERVGSAATGRMWPPALVSLCFDNWEQRLAAATAAIRVWAPAPYVHGYAPCHD